MTDDKEDSPQPWWRLIGIFLIIGLCLWFIPRIDWIELREALGEASWSWILPAVGGVLSLWFLRGLLLWLILSLKEKLSFWWVLMVHVVGGMMDQLIPGRGGYLLRWIWLSLEGKFSKSFVFSALLVSVLVEGAVLVAILVLAVLLGRTQAFALDVVLWLSAIVLLFCFFVVFIHPIKHRIRSTSWLHWKPLLAFVEIAEEVRSPRVLALWLVIAVGQWSFQLVVLKSLLLSFAIELSIFEMLVLLLSINLSIVVPIVPANIGTLQLVITGVLQQFGVSMGTALAFSIVYHITYVAPLMMIGSFTYLKVANKAR